MLLLLHELRFITRGMCCTCRSQLALFVPSVSLADPLKGYSLSLANTTDLSFPLQALYVFLSHLIKLYQMFSISQP